MISSTPQDVFLGVNWHNIVRSLWVGPALSAMERLCIQSFLAHGHEFHLYVYEDVRNIPAGTIVRDAREILPSSRIFEYAQFPGTYAGFANFFRYKMLLEQGGWWTDMDVVCMRRFDFDRDYVFSSEGIRAERLVNCGVIKAPPGSDIMRRAWLECDGLDTTTLRWGVTGPRLTTRLVQEFGIAKCVEPPESFMPYDYPEFEIALDGSTQYDFPDAYGIHLWHEWWRRHGKDRDGRYPPECLYERLKRRYGVE